MTARETTLADLAATGATVHPFHHLRDHLTRLGAHPAAAVGARPGQTRIRIGGIIKSLQRPPTPNGMAFAVCEDETGTANLVIAPTLWDRTHRALLDAPRRPHRTRTRRRQRRRPPSAPAGALAG